MINLNDISTGQPALKLDDIQGIILRGYTFPYVRYIVFKINDKAGTQAFFSKLLPRASDMEITSAKPWDRDKRPEYTLTIGLTYSGIKTLIADDDLKKVKNTSSNLFRTFADGIIADKITIGDINASDPENWWQEPGKWKLGKKATADNSELQVLITLYAGSDADREKYYQKLLALIPPVNSMSALQEAYVHDSDPLKSGDDYIHFGYRDSLSQPRLSDVPWNTTKGRLLLGKSNVDDRPVVPPYQFVVMPKYKKDPNDPLSPMIPKYRTHPLLYNGSFAAFRVLHQDVHAFKAFINNPKHDAPADLVAAKMCGRWYDGTPLVVSPHGPDSSLKDFDYTNFNYMEATDNQRGDMITDDLGQRCPYAAHIRRTNPRDDYKVQGNTNYAEDKRIMRRAGPYGPDYDESKPDDKPRGLVGLFICANLKEQFSFIMGSWIMAGGFRNAPNSDLSPNKSGIDPVFGPVDDMAANQDFDFMPNGDPPPPYKELKGLKQFISTHGGLYLFLPGIDALRHLANGTIPKL